MNLDNIGVLTRNSVYLSAADSILLYAPRSIQDVLFRLGSKFNADSSVVHISICWDIEDSIKRHYESR